MSETPPAAAPKAGSAHPAAPPPAEPGASPPEELTPDLRWARGFLAAARDFAAERNLQQIHIEVTLVGGETFPVMSVGPGGPPGFIGFGVETDELRERIRDKGEAVPSPRGVYVPFAAVAKIEFLAEAPEHAIGFTVERGLDP